MARRQFGNGIKSWARMGVTPAAVPAFARQSVPNSSPGQWGGSDASNNLRWATASVATDVLGLPE